ncbi:hypothetical protein FAIPA1_440013 [Frankia sp. AiPs1]|nr:LysR family transcriptional regulator [Frankia sp. AiPa1]
MTQPPLSRAIRQLEADLGIRLLERTSAGVALTAAGETLLVEARALLEQASRLEVRVRDAAGQRRITIGSLADGTACQRSHRSTSSCRQASRSCRPTIVSPASWSWPGGRRTTIRWCARSWT